MLLLLLLPVATFQGWGWLPLWWLALLFVYLDRAEKALVFGRGGGGARRRPGGVRARASACARRGTRSTTRRSRSWRRRPGARRSRRLAEAAARDPEDRDLLYLLGGARRRAGRYEEAAELYRRALAADPADAVARNNLANIEFVRGGYDSALGPLPRGHGGRDGAGGSGHLVLQPLAGPPAEVRVPGLQRGQVERRPPGPGARGGLRSVEVRLRRLRGRRPRPDARAGAGQVRGRRVGSRGAKRRRRGAAARGAGDARLRPGEPLRGGARGASPSPPTWSRAGAGRRPSRCTARAAGRPSAATATSAR